MQKKLKPTRTRVTMRIAMITRECTKLIPNLQWSRQGKRQGKSCFNQI